MAQGLAPIFDEATRRTHLCKSSRDTLAVAVWVYAQLSNLPTKQPEPVQPEGDEQGEGDDAMQGDGGIEAEGEGEGEEGEGDAPTDDGNGSPSPDKGQGKGKVATAPEKGSEAMEVEPTNKAPDDTGSHGSFNQTSAMQKNGYHVAKRKRFTLGA